MKRVIRDITASDEITYTIPVRWEMTTVMQMQASSLKEAVQKVNQHGFELPEGAYVNDSFEIDFDKLEE